MAVNTQPDKLAKDFLPRLRWQVTMVLIIGEFILLAAIITILYLAHLLVLHPFISAEIILVSIAITIISDIITYRMLSQPLKDLTDAVVHVSGEMTTTTPPNPNDERFVRNGFKSLLQTLYQLASARDQEKSDDDDARQATKDAIQAALDATVCGFVTLDQQRHVTFANKAAPTNVTKDGETILALLFPQNNTLDQWLDNCDQSAVHAENSWTRIPDRLPDEEGRRFFDVFATYDKDAKNEVVVTLIDRTKLYEIGEQELDFIAFAAHELRGPITVIRGYLDVLQDELHSQLQNDQEELFHRLTVSANRLSAYINNILNTSRYDRRHLKVHLEETTLASVYDLIRDDMQLRALAQNRLLTVTIPTTLPTIAADPGSFSEVMANLIDNAIKYSNEGGAINVHAEQKGDTIELAVEDNGIGMPTSVISNLFQKFYRSHRSRETVAGTGIGLYISKAIVESHGGTISVRSEDGKGSTFIVTLPTYAMVADQLLKGDNSNESVIRNNNGWIKNHTMYRG